MTSYVLTMVVNALATGLIVFKILKVFLQVRATSTLVERSLGSTGGTNLQHVLFVIIESGMALFVIQLVLLVLWLVPSVEQKYLDFLMCINRMFNVIIRFTTHFFLFFCFFY